MYAGTIQGDAQSSQSGEGKRSARQRSSAVNYSEVDKDIDALLEADAASAPVKRQKLSDDVRPYSFAV